MDAPLTANIYTVKPAKMITLRDDHLLATTTLKSVQANTLKGASNVTSDQVLAVPI